MVVQRFCRAYMESPPPAVFHYKYQSYKYERNTAGKSATFGGPGGGPQGLGGPNFVALKGPLLAQNVPDSEISTNQFCF